jgi:C1A family cysteine protease
MSEIINHGFGWMPELPDFRDYSIETDEVHSIFEAVTMKINPIATQGKKSKNEEITLAIPAQVDVRNWCSPIENQGQIGSCTAHAGSRTFGVLSAKSLWYSSGCKQTFFIQSYQKPSQVDRGHRCISQNNHESHGCIWCVS